MTVQVRGDRHRRAGLGGSGHTGEQPGLGQFEVVVLSRREAISEAIQVVTDAVGVTVAHDPRNLFPDGLLVVDHLFPDPVSGAAGATVVVGLVGEEAALLRCVRRIGAAHAIVLPTGCGWLCQFLRELMGSPGPRDAVEGSGSRTDDPQVVAGKTRSAEHVPDGLQLEGIEPSEMDQAGICIGVIPGCGGCGASTLTVALGLAGARHGDVLLVDADPWGQGLGLSLGWDGPDQAGWNLIAPDTEQLDAQELRAVLPQDVGFWVLAGSGDSTADVPEALAAVVAAARNGFDVTVVDLGRTAAGVAAARRCDAVVLVLPTTLAGVLGARRILEQLEQVRPVSGSPIRVVLACRDVGGLTPDSIAEYLGHDVALVYRSSRLIRERASVGELVQGRSGRKLASWGRQLLEVLA